MAPQSQNDFGVELGPRAVDDPLARELRRRIASNLARGHGVAAFRRMWGTVVVVAVLPGGQGAADGEPELPNQVTLTLRFDWGRLMIHEGRVGRPDVTLWGPVDSILGIGDGPRLVRRQLGERFARVATSRTLAPVWALTNLLSVPELRIYGLAYHGRLVWRLARLLASESASDV